MGKIGHSIVGILNIIATVFCACALTDGRSIVTIRTDSKDLTVQLAGVTTNLQIQALPGIGYPYGIGAYQDSNGRRWTSGDGYAEITAAVNSTDLTRKSSHITQLYGCDDHQRRGQLVNGCLVICLITSCISVLISLRGVSTESRLTGILSLVFQCVGALFFLLGMAGGASLYDGDFECKSGTAVVFDLRLRNYFDLSYAIPFLVVGLIASILNIVIIVGTGSLSEPKHQNTPDDDSSSN